MAKTKNTEGQVSESARALIDALAKDVAMNESEATKQGYVSGQEICRMMGTARETTRNRLDKMVKSGAAEKIKVVSGGAVSNWFRMKR